MPVSRRTLFRTSVVGGAVAASPLVDLRPSAAAPTLRRNPFRLGVTSGWPAPGGFLLWTRLAVDPIAADGHGGMPNATYPVRYQVARDSRFTNVVRSGTFYATYGEAHSVHVGISGLSAHREYFYRFRVGTWFSRVGRAVTAPAFDAMPTSLHMAFASCANYRDGYYTAYRRMAEERPDVILFLGDFIYEGAGGNPAVRDHVGPTCTTLANYRQRYGQYKTDPDLQAAMAASSWVPVWDDHEVQNNYAGSVPPGPYPDFLSRRAAAYQAFYENMPMRRVSVPSGPDSRIYGRVHWGQLATFHMLDGRQYRDDQACGDGWKSCPDASAEQRSMLGADQEAWLADGLAASTRRWDFLGQQTFFGRRDRDSGSPVVTSMDGWDGYTACRRRVVSSWERGGVRNPVVLSGDVHSHWGSEITTNPDDPTSPVSASEFVTSSVSSAGSGYDSPTGQHPWAAWNPNLRFWTNLRGYVSTTVTPASLTVRYRCVPLVSTAGEPAFTRAEFVVNDRVRGMVKTADHPTARVASTSPTARLAPAEVRDQVAPTPSAERIIADTLRNEG